jgi:integrase
VASVEQRDSATGRVWRVRFRHDGKNKAVTFTDAQRAEDWRRLVEVNVEQALAALEESTGEPPRTVAEQVRSHVEHLTGISTGTRGDYLSYLANDIEPHRIGSRLVKDLDHEAVAEWVNWLQGRGLAGHTIANRHGLLSAAMSSAVRDKIATDNPCRGMRLPRTSHLRQEMTFLDRDEFARLWSLVHERYRPLVLLLVGTGMRFGEATALHVADVDLSARSVRVRKAWKRTRKSVKELGPTKSLRSDRTVAIPAQVAEALRPLAEGRPANALLFTNARGGEVKQSTFWTRVWQPAVCAFAGDEITYDHDKDGRKVLRVVSQGPGKHPRIHDLRHTFASWAIQSRVPLPVIQRQLGHEKITTTIDTYGHLARADFDALAEATGANLPALLPPALP